MNPLSDDAYDKTLSQNGTAKVVPLHFRRELETEQDGTATELLPNEAELLPNETELLPSQELIGVASVLDQLPQRLKVTTAANEYFPWSVKHTRSNLIPDIADGLRISREALLDRGTLTEEGIHLLASYEQACSRNVSIFVDGKRVEVRPRAEGDAAMPFDEWIQVVLRERRHAAQQIPPIDPSVQDANTDTSGFEAPEDSSALVIGGEGFDIDTFIDQQLNQMGGVEDSAITLLEEVEAELVDTSKDFDSLNHSSRQLLTRHIAAQAVQDAAGDERLYNDTYLAARRRIQSRRAQSQHQQPGKPRGGNSPGVSG